jgi:hypothetical protein
VINVGGVLVNLAISLYTREHTQERNLIAVVNVGRDLVDLEI